MRASAFVGSQSRQWMSKVYVSAGAAVAYSELRLDSFDEGGWIQLFGSRACSINWLNSFDTSYIHHHYKDCR
jgi:hypothetical protein